MVSSYTAVPRDEQNRQRLGDRWKHGRTFGCSRYGSGDRMEYYSSWLPSVWNSLCISAASKDRRGWFRVVLNDELLYETTDYRGIYRVSQKMQTCLDLILGLRMDEYGFSLTPHPLKFHFTY